VFGCKFKIISILENIGVHIAAINQIIKDENEKWSHCFYVFYFESWSQKALDIEHG